MVEHLVWDQGVAGSNPVFPILKDLGALAQLGERLPCTQEVSGSIPLGSISMYLVEKLYGGVAQLARASGSYPGGRGFESLRRYITILLLMKLEKCDAKRKTINIIAG